MKYFLHPAGYSFTDGYLWDVNRDLERDIESNSFQTKEKAIEWACEFIKNNNERFNFEGFGPKEHCELEVCTFDRDTMECRKIVDWLIIKENSIMLHSTREDIATFERKKEYDPLAECKACGYFMQTPDPEWKGKPHCTWVASDYDAMAPCDADEYFWGEGNDDGGDSDVL